jgi:Domain of unknown function (DUF6265)
MSPLPISSALLAVCLGLPAAALAQASNTLPSWMAGRWCTTSANERSEEVWLAPAGGLMVGMGRTVSVARAKAQFEFLRIEMRDGVPSYLAQPQGRPAVEFRQVQGDQRSVRFENLAHDFPKRIEYRRDGDALHAQISGPGKEGREFAIAFTYTSCADETQRP